MTKHQVLSILAFEIAAISIASVAIAQAASPGRRIIEIMSHKCNRATEISYQSKQLLSPDESTQVHFEGVLRKVVDDSKSPPYSSNGLCHADKVQTLMDQLVVDRQGAPQVFDGTKYDGAYIVLEPLSFSPNGQYLVANTEFVYADSSSTRGFVAFNLDDGQLVLMTNRCFEPMDYQMDKINYIGFVSEAEMIIECQSASPPRGTGGSSRFEAVNLQSGTVRRLVERPNEATNYGTELSHFEIKKVQRFD